MESETLWTPEWRHKANSSTFCLTTTPFREACGPDRYCSLYILSQDAQVSGFVARNNPTHTSQVFP